MPAKMCFLVLVTSETCSIRSITVKTCLLRYYPELRTKSELGRKCAATERLNKMLKNKDRAEAMSLLGEMAWREETTSQRTEASFMQWHRTSLEK